MRFEERRALLRSLAGRLARDPSLAARVPPEETAALYALLGLPPPARVASELAPAGAGRAEEGRAPPEASPPPSSPDAPPETRGERGPPPEATSPPEPSARRARRPRRLRLDGADARPADDVVLCLDFGTASAKVGALRGGRAPLPLRLGDDGDFAVDASAYLDAGGGLAFGSLARQRSLEEGRPRLDSLKRLLGRVPLDRPLDALPFEALGVRGGGAASLGLVLRVYLAWLVHRARTALAAHHGIEGPAPLRFALPCWPSARWLALEPAIGRLVAEAILLADTLGPELEDGVDVREARHLAQLAAETPRIPAALVGRSIMEPVAAAASRFGPEAPARGLVLVVDVGAGTTDLALFTLEADPDRGHFEICPVEGGTDLVPRAGDHLDRALGQIALERLQGEHRPPRSLRAQIALRARAWKERLVADGAIELDLGRGARLEREELFEHPEVADLEPRLRARARALLERIPRSRLEPLAAHGLTVCLAGGGASLPMVASLVRGATTAGDITLEHRPGPALPPFVRDRPDLARDYPRLAVCLGGASGYLPRHAAPAFRS